MKTEVWVYTVRQYAERQTNIFWQGVFDCEVSDARVLKEYHEKTGKKITDALVRSKRRTFYPSHRDPVSIVPEVQSGTLFSLEQNMQRENWFNDQLTKFSLDQPILCEYLQNVKVKQGELAALVGVVIHKLIESQIEADQL